MNRTEARMVAEELAKLMRKEIQKMVIDIVASDMDGFMSASEAADFLGWKKQTLYNRIEEVPHVKFGKLLKFQKSKLREYING